MYAVILLLPLHIDNDLTRRPADGMLARHAAHMADVMGIEHVACGFDFCEFFGPGNEGAQGMEDCSRSGNFLLELEKLGMTARERELVARENFLRILA